MLGLVTLQLGVHCGPQFRPVEVGGASARRPLLDLTDDADVDHAVDGVSGRIDGVGPVDGDEDGT